ncbi:2-amino-4-hydroxy-6-hydroxymethyldihydropteridine pyrophosphokinase [Tsuneonella dongtanensis]|uniref:2-amino-4-hydroxy-6-hydroxymethyldihydropteridine pyrophosphokinase n=1 Tax=Tsuneonella dongtanensis TaxID=692370 RepID=A0A1B2A9C1_9SPHN|nr:2-amino-4-hydroxy-6-hydroxymethyldihydropteridine diphosphokinase [Tsuneonella dongtanensis]ANY18678.1 2-amino-4-hydroxy-6-hydroxymethyldihydropteridine pyrophosphokinase [Tsuneonella dongtanensis]
MRHRFLVALGSNVRHPRFGLPRQVLRAALAALEDAGLAVDAMSPIVDSAPLGPSSRHYANAAAVISTRLEPEEVLDLLQAIEHAFGRVRRGARWGARVLDLDIALWSGGSWFSERLVIPHPEFNDRRFAVAPAARIARAWRDPLTGLTVGQIEARLTRASPLS